MLKYILLSCIVGIYGNLFSQIIPEDRTIDWSIAGQEADFTDPEQEVNVMDYGAAGDGTQDDSPAIQSAIEALGGEPGIVFMPEGTYLIEESLSLPTGVVVRGVDSVLSRIIIDFGGEAQDAINVNGSVASDFQAIESGYTKGSTSIEVGDATEFEQGDYAEIVENNGDWYTEPASWAENSVGQIIHISQVEGNTLTFGNPLRITYQESLDPRIRKITPVVNVAVENLGIERLDEPDEGAGSNIDINLAANVRIKDIESNKSVGSHINVHRSTQVWLTGSYIHHAFTYDGSGTRGYGIALHMHTGECLVDNNIFKHLRHAMMAKTGSNGNVFGYNYSIEPYRSETIHDFSGDISMHGHYGFANLFEGNIVQNIIVDHYWGETGPFNTFFRNRAELYGFIITSSDNPTDQQNIVGLEITNTDFLYGMYQTEGEDHYEYGNNVTGNMEPFFTDSLPDSSYYLIQEPDFWNIADPWPSIGVPLEYNTWSIPSKERYLGNTTGIDKAGNAEVFSVRPNPFFDHVTINVSNAARRKVKLIMTDMQGRRYFEQMIEAPETINTRKLPPGVYIISLTDEHTTRSKKIIKSR